MTFIQPNHNTISILNRVIAGIVLVLLVNIFWLVALYNNIVNLNHNIQTAKAQVDVVGAKNAALNNQVVAALGNIQSGGLAAQDGLVQDNHPQYISPSWPIASQQ